MKGNEKVELVKEGGDNDSKNDDDRKRNDMERSNFVAADLRTNVMFPC